MRLLKQSTAASVMVLMVDSTDHITGKTGLTLTITASKNGAAFASISPTVNERGSGWYELQLTTAHTDTLGDLALHITATGADPADPISYVVVRHLADLAWPATSGRSLAVESDGMVFADLREWLGVAPLSLTSQRVEALIGAMATNVLTAAAINADAFTAAKFAADVTTELQAGLATASALSTHDTDIKARLPAALVSGRIDASVGAMAAGVVTAAAVATDAIDGDAIAASAVTEIQAGLATTANVSAVETDTQDIQNRLPAALVAGRMSSQVGAMGTDVLTAAAIAADAVTELQAGLATSSALSTAQGDITSIKAKTDNLPSGIKRNTALAKFSFLMVDSADHVTPKTGLTGFTAQRSLDGAAFASCANAVSELANGIYLIDLAAGDLDGDVVTLRFVASGGDARLLTVVTEP